MSHEMVWGLALNSSSQFFLASFDWIVATTTRFQNTDQFDDQLLMTLQPIYYQDDHEVDNILPAKVNISDLTDYMTYDEIESYYTPRVLLNDYHTKNNIMDAGNDVKYTV